MLGLRVIKMLTLDERLCYCGEFFRSTVSLGVQKILLFCTYMFDKYSVVSKTFKSSFLLYLILGMRIMVGFEKIFCHKNC